MPVFEESGLRFDFDARWAVRKYDAHRFFQGFSGAGLKGVDFIALHGSTLILLEIKNYQRRQRWQTENPFDPILAAPGSFANHMASKYLDTLRALRAIGTYYHRQWLFRLLHPVLVRLPGRKMDWVFWARVDQHLREGRPVTALLWLETEPKQTDFLATLKVAITPLLRASVATFQIVNLEGAQIPEGITVTALPDQ
ncbi:MAG: hypothetical protein RIC19_21725 [Phaeodactylibacter sp.]|uniref:hypothetical protein n=1 Tax=Phaeodactylibacter sp. TaxID=1940289 RepID=UPI0032EEE7C7